MSISYSSLPTTVTSSPHAFDTSITLDSSSLSIPTLKKSSAPVCNCGGSCECCKSKDEAPNIAHNSNQLESPRPSSSVSQPIIFPTSNPIPPPGGYLEPNSHFFVTETPHGILQYLINVLNSKSVDWNMCPNQYKLKCEAYRHNVRIEFIARIFHTPCPFARPYDPPRYAVEFQRRFGCGMFFFQLFQEIYDAFVPIEANACPKRRAMRLENPNVLECPELDLPELKCSAQTANDDLEAFIEMSSSDCVDIKTMSIAALADLSAKPEFKYIMLEKGCAELFMKNLNCTYGDVHRCAMTGLCNLISCGKNKSVCSKIFEEQRILSAIEKHTTSKCPKIVREAARALQYLCKTMKGKANGDDSVKRCVLSLSHSGDTQTREVAQNTLETLQSE